MKKAIIGLSALVILSFVVLMFVNAQTDAPKGKKEQTEATAKCCPASTDCPKAAQASAGCAVSNPEKCKELGCDPATCPKAKAEGCKMQAAAPACGKQCPLSAQK